MEIIIRHEFGHVAGLAHATAPEDLMYPVIQTPVSSNSNTCSIYFRV
jgi:predicted Zn-dependent protease